MNDQTKTVLLVSTLGLMFLFGNLFATLNYKPNLPKKTDSARYFLRDFSTPTPIETPTPIKLTEKDTYWETSLIAKAWYLDKSNIKIRFPKVSGWVLGEYLINSKGDFNVNYVYTKNPTIILKFQVVETEYSECIFNEKEFVLRQGQNDYFIVLLHNPVYVRGTFGKLVIGENPSESKPNEISYNVCQHGLSIKDDPRWISVTDLGFAGTTVFDASLKKEVLPGIVKIIQGIKILEIK